ncbi:hypothetical protein DL96DRAFT_1539284, partial [Flagelloscypha sp. PMI_526]
MIQGFRDTIDSLLVLAGLFSAIVATFVAQTSQSLKPDFAQLNLLVQIEQASLLRMGGNVSAMSLMPSSGITTETQTHTRADLWINGLFFTSLSLSMATALLAVLVKQWCQAYVAVTSGSAKDKCLTRQFRFDGLIKWKLPEIVGSLPLLLHVAFGVFFAGLSYFVYDLHGTLSSIVIITTIVAAIAYIGTLILPAIWLECPYRIPLLFRPARLVVYLCIMLRGIFFPNARSTSTFSALSKYLPQGERNRTEILTSLKHAEEVLLGMPYIPFVRDSLAPPMAILAKSLVWLFTLSKNKSTRRIVAAALHGCLVEYWQNDGFNSPDFLLFMEKVCFSSIAEAALDSVITLRDVNQLRVPIALLDDLFNRDRKYASSYALRSHQRSCPVSQESLDWALMSLMERSSVHPHVRSSLVRWGANVHFNSYHPFHPSPLRRAIETGDLDNVRWLLEAKASVNNEHSNGKVLGRTALIHACVKGHFDIAKYLVQQGSDVNRAGTSPWGHVETPLVSALLNIKDESDLEFIGYLIDCGANLKRRLNGVHDTALGWAVKAKKVEVVRFLLERDAVADCSLRFLEADS